jgi:AcrR family transcriptional regulator
MIDRPAAPRGRYDRRKTATERSQEHQSRLVAAAAEAARVRGRSEVTVSDLVTRAKVGRNTFYAHFSGLDGAMTRAEQVATDLLWRRTSEALAAAYTPIEKVRAIVRGSFDAVDADPALMRLLLESRSRSEGWVLSRVGDALRQLLKASLADARRTAVLSTAVDDARLIAVTSMLETLARRYLDLAKDRGELEPLAVDLVLRAFR